MSDEPEIKDVQDHEAEYASPGPEFTIDLENMPKQDHNWVNRGLKMTCESPSHPYHEAWFRRTI